MELKDSLIVINWHAKRLKFLRKYLKKIADGEERPDPGYDMRKALDDFAWIHYGIRLYADHNARIVSELVQGIWYTHPTEHKKPEIDDLISFVEQIEDEKEHIYDLKSQALYILEKQGRTETLKYFDNHGELQKTVIFENCKFDVFALPEEVIKLANGEIKKSENPFDRIVSMGMPEVKEEELIAAIKTVRKFISDNKNYLYGWVHHDALKWRK